MKKHISEASEEQKPARTRVLMVDDEGSQLRMLKLHLEKSGEFEVVTATRPQEALEILARETFSIIILDVIMPQIDGGELFNAIRRREIKTPIIFLTATVSKREAGEGGLSSGGTIFLAKPVAL